MEGPASSVRVGPDAVEQRRLVTVLFADLSGFTSLAEELDPEELVEVMDPVLSAMTAAVTRYGGTVSKYAGDAILAFFGAPIAHDDDARRAVLAACDMRHRLAGLTDNLPNVDRQLELHIGINTGHVVSGQRGSGDQLDYSVLGDAVNVAQRLEAAAPPGEIYVGDLTRRLAGDVADFDDLGALTVKGKRESVAAWRVREREESGERSSVHASTIALIGRDRQLAGLRAAAVHPGAVIGIAGEPGIGKTRLLQAVREELVAEGAQWLAARCVSFGASLPYRPYADLLHDVVSARRDAPTQEVATRITQAAVTLGLDEQAPFLVRLLGAAPADPAGQQLVPEALRARMHDAVASLLCAIATGRRTVVAIEDLHWCDEASRELTRLLVQKAQASDLVVITTLRPEGRSAFDVIATPAPHRTLVDISGLDRDGVRLVAEGVLDGELDEPLVDLIFEHTRGNPLFVEEVSRALRSTSQLQHTDGLWALGRARVDVDVPPTVEAVLAARIDALPPDTAAVLQTAAVIGREVPMLLLERLVGTARDSLDAHLGTLVGQGLVDATSEGEQRITFHHALVVSVAYSRMLRRQRRVLHKAVVDAATDIYGDGEDVIELLAHHAYQAELGDDAIALLSRAASRATRLYANREALDHLDKALEAAGGASSTHARSVRLLLDKAAMHARLGEYDHALAAFELASHREPVAAAVGAAETLRKLGRYTDAERTAAAAENAPGLSPQARASLQHQRGAAMSYAGHSESQAVLSGALALVEGSGTLLEATIRVELARLLQLGGRLAEAAEQAERAVRVFEANDELTQLPMALRVLGGIRADVADETASANDLALETLRRAYQVACRIGHLEEQAAALINMGNCLCGSRPEEAIAPLTQALALFEQINIKAGIAAARANLANAYHDMGCHEEAGREAAAGLIVARELDHKYWITGCLIGLGQAASARGDIEDAVGHFEEAATMADAAGLPGRAEVARMWTQGLA